MAIEVGLIVPPHGRASEKRCSENLSRGSSWEACIISTCKSRELRPTRLSADHSGRMASIEVGRMSLRCPDRAYTGYNHS